MATNGLYIVTTKRLGSYFIRMTEAGITPMQEILDAYNARQS
jgi:hypothetical protein